jgi:hypothetical protein
VATPVPRSLLAAVVVIALQALALVLLTVIVLVKVITEHPHSLAGALFGAAWAAIGALILAGCARSMLRMTAAARTPVVVIELLALPVSYTLTFQAHRLDYGAPILISALVVLYLLFTPTARTALDREPS